MDHIIEREEREYLERVTREKTLELMDDMISCHERGIREMRRQRERFVTAFDEHDKKGMPGPADVLGWFTNEAQNVSRNVRYDLLAARGAELGVLTWLRGEKP